MLKLRAPKRGWSLACAAGGGFVLGALTVCALPSARAFKTLGPASMSPERRVFERSIQQLQRDYVTPRSSLSWWRKLTRCATQDLDRYTYFLDPQERRRIQEAPGLGLAVSRPPSQGADAPLQVVAVTPGGAAQKAGLSVGTRIDAINKIPAKDLQKQAQIDLALRASDRARVTIQSAKARVQLSPTKTATQGELWSTTFKCNTKTCLYVHMTHFGSGLAPKIRALLSPGRSPTIAGVMFDLRNNPGGEIQQAIAIADMLLTKGRITLLRGRKGAVLTDYQATATQTLDSNIPVLVLIDASSASAAELLAAALQDHGRAKIVGERSFGKGSVQANRVFADGSSLRYTRAHYYSPNDHEIHGRGVKPDMHLHIAAPPSIGATATKWMSQLWSTAGL